MKSIHHPQATLTIVIAECGVVVALHVTVAITHAVGVRHLAHYCLVVEVIGITACEPLRTTPRAKLGYIACFGAAIAAVPLALERVERALVVANTISDLAGVRWTRVRV